MQKLAAVAAVVTLLPRNDAVMTNSGELVLPAGACVAEAGQSAGTLVIDRELMAATRFGAEKRHHRSPLRSMGSLSAPIAGGDYDMSHLVRNRLPEEIVVVLFQHRPVVTDNRRRAVYAESDHAGSLATQIEADLHGRKF